MCHTKECHKPKVILKLRLHGSAAWLGPLFVYYQSSQWALNSYDLHLQTRAAMAMDKGLI